MFRDAATDNDSTNLEEYMPSVMSYISKCIDDITVSKTIITHSNQKSWMTAEMRKQLRDPRLRLQKRRHGGLKNSEGQTVPGLS